MFTKTSYLRRKLKGLCLMVFNRIENNGNADFDMNGEKMFIDNLFERFCENGATSKVLFDIGANIGKYAQMIEKKALESNIDIHLHLFEPTQSCFSVLSQKFDTEKITLNRFGASDQDGTAMIFYDKEQSGLASLYQRNLESYNVALDRQEEIALRRLDAYIEENGIAHIDFVKIDVEGHELKAFEGFGSYISGDFIDFIQFEYGGANLDSHTSLMEIYTFLEKRGFKIAKIMPDGLEIRQYSPYMDNFQYANFVAISDKVFKN